MTVIAKVHGIADGTHFRHDFWIESYDLNTPPPDDCVSFTRDGLIILNGVFGGVIRLTPERAKAMRFNTIGHAFRCLQTQSEAHPLRPDGRPNKPLTALHVEVEPW